ncbi:TetR/AcrR family transcriptional regulator [Roseomonas sp. BN140053]|uniref:TetR/AcrR family transcriptional regulator n=1 Tax=Roseomonas sp. BN140053 TaxID=3391898 RepID=UPI0039EB576A
MSQSVSGRDRQRQRTRRDLLAAARELVAEGRQPTVQEVADHAGISRATAYRYFSTPELLVQEALLDAVAGELDRFGAAGPPRGPEEVPAALDALVERVMGFVLRQEGLFRAYLAQAVTPMGGAVQPRGGRRVDWIREVLAPLRGIVPEPALEELVSALCLLTGIETVVVLRDVRGLGDAAIVETVRRIARALLAATRAG